MEFTPEKVEQVVVEFYRNPAVVNKECHELLKQFQLSREAWQIVWYLLQPEKSVELQFVAANSLYFKVTKCLAEIPTNELPALKDKLVATLVQYAGGPPLVTTRLGLTVAAFIFNTIGTAWLNPLEELGSTFQPQNFPGLPDTQVLRLLIQVFSYVPEQSQAVSQPLSKRSIIFQSLQSKGDTMFSWLYNVLLTQSNPDLIVQLLKAFNSWMKISCICSWARVLQFIETLVNLSASAAASDEDTVCESCLEVLSSVVADPSATMYPSLMLDILAKILPLQASIDNAIVKDDVDSASSFYSLFVAMADCHSKLCVEAIDEESSYCKENPQHRLNATQLVGIILRCTGTPGIYPIEETSSSITISVWYSLMEEINLKQSDEKTYGRLMVFFDDVYKSLAEILVRKSQYPLENFDSWSSDEKEQFRIYRQDIGDCLTYCFDLRGWATLNELVSWGERIADTIETDISRIDRQWPEIESILNAMRAVTENVNDDPADRMMMESMTRVFNVIFRVLKLNQIKKMPKVFQAAIECISSCSSLLYCFDSVVKNVIVYILEGLFQPDVVTSSALALKTLSRECSNNLSEYAAQIITTCKQALCSGTLGENDCMRLVYSVGRFLLFLPMEQILCSVDELFAPGLAQLQQIAAVEPQPALQSQLISILNTFSTLCYSLDPCLSSDDDDCPGPVSASNGNKPENDPLVPIVEKILPTLINVAENWARDELVMESLMGIVKHTLASLHLTNSSVVQHSIQLVVISFKHNPLPVSCNIAKQTILMLGKEHLQIQCQFLSQIHTLCFDRLRNARDNLEFAESYFIMLAQIIRSDPALIKESKIPITPTLDLAVQTLSYSEAPILKAGVYFVTACVNACQNAVNNVLREYMIMNGSSVVQKMMLSVGCVVPRNSVQYFAELMVAFNRTFPAEWRKWLNEVLAVEGFPTPHIEAEIKAKFLSKVTRGQANKRGVQDALNEFAAAGRNMYGTDYAAMTAKRL